MAHVKQTSTSSTNSGTKQAWGNCIFCSDLSFKDPNDFTRHLRIRHCTREGGSFVCRYGNHGVCSSLPVEGVSDEDYEDHVLRHHVYPSTAITNNSISRKPMDRSKDPKSLGPDRSGSQSSVSGDKEPWTIFSSSQNLPAVLNDPGRGKQKDFFTKLWGDDFVENAYIGKPEHLPEVTAAHFETYLRKISRRYRRHVKINATAASPPPMSDVLQQFPNLRLSRTSPEDCACSICIRDPAIKFFLDKCQFDVSAIPKIFLQSSFDLRNPETFNAVYTPTPRESDSSTPTSPTSPSAPGPSKPTLRQPSSGKLLQEKLTHYLDLVEVQIAHQVAQKSEAFFEAMTSHDALMDQLSRTISLVRLLREKVKKIDQVLVKESLKIIRMERLRCNHTIVFEKLKLMSTVHQTQPMLQLLLSAPNYVAALDLISTTQEILVQELAGVRSFRHLGSQLMEMERLIDKMLSAEFERYATADLNRPLTDHVEVLEGEKLVSIVFGMLRQKHFNFIDKYREEAFTTIKAVVKQLVIEELAASDSGEGEVRLTGTGDQLQVLSLTQWCHLLERATNTLLKLIKHVKAVHDVMRDAADVSAGKPQSSASSASPEDGASPTASCDHIPNLHNAMLDTEHLLLPEERALVVSRLNELLCAVCDHAHDRCAQLMSAQSRESWLDRAAASQVCDLARLIDSFVESCEKLCGKPSPALQSAFKVQASKFVAKFHQERKDKLALILDSECWKQADVPPEFQVLADTLATTGKIILPKRDIESSDRKASNALMVGKERYAVVGTVLLLLKMIAEYCQCAEDLTIMAPNLLRHLIELLQLFNSRSCQLVLGAGALHAVGLNTITSTNLALTSRALQLVLVALAAARNQLLPLVQDSQRLVTHLDHLEKDIRSHGKEIENKLLTLVGGLLSAQLVTWDAKPPVPSTSFRNISKHLRKLHEAISDVLPLSQVQHLYRCVHKAFKQRLKEQLIKMNVVNNGGPQHGVVISELTFYLETLRTLKSLPMDELMMGNMEDIWSR